MTGYILLGILLGAGGVFLVMRRRMRELERELERTEKEREEERRCVIRASGLDEHNRLLAERKEGLKNQILGLFKKKEKITNSDVGEALDIPRRSATRYLEELEQKGRVAQVGIVGRGVEYVLK